MATLPHRARNTDRFELNRTSWQAAGLVGWFPLGAYPDAKDKSLSGNNGTIVGPVPSAMGQRRGLSFDGSDDIVRVDNESRLRPSESLTLMAWIKSDGTGGARDPIISKWIDSDGSWTSYSLNIQTDADLQFTVQNKTGVYYPYWTSNQSAHRIPTDTWAHVAAVWRGPIAGDVTDGSLYLNGIPYTGIYLSFSAGGYTADFTTEYSTYPLVIGSRYATGNWFFDGLIDDARVYNRALSDNEVAAIYNQTRSGGYGDLAVLPTRRIGINPLMFADTGLVGTASVSPVSSAWSVPAVTATHSIVISASASPVAAAWSVPAVTATYVTSPSASVSPVTAAWGVPAVTATRTAVFSASASPVAATWSTPAVTATHATSHSASVSPVTAAWSTTATTATYAAVLSASASPVTAAWSVPSMTATTSAVALPTVFYSTRGLSTVSMAALGTANAEAELVGAGGVSLLVKGK